MEGIGVFLSLVPKKNLNFTELSVAKNIEIQLVLVLKKLQNLKICSKKK